MMDVNTIGRETVANWMILRGYALGRGDTVQGLLFEIEAQAKGRGEPPEPTPGQGDFEILQRKLADARTRAEAAERDLEYWRNTAKEEAEAIERRDAEIERLKAALSGLLNHYIRLAESGDAGFWDPEKEPVVIAARAALGSEQEARLSWPPGDNPDQEG